jgi:hypothetical protein
VADSETDRLRELREIKRQRLHELDKQAERYGYDVPAHIALERAELQKELKPLDVVVDRAPSAAFVEELGGSGRFGVTYGEIQRANDGIALLGERLDDFIAISREWRAMHRQWIILIGIVVVVILVAFAVVATYVFTRGV